MNRACWFLLFSLSAAASAQTVLVVDGLNRPGTNFTDLPAAEAAASDGDVLRLRSDGGNYTGVQTHKALTIVADIGQAFITSPPGQAFEVSGIPAGKQFTMRGCFIGGRNVNGPVLRLANCAGRVVLAQIEVILGAPNIEITGCAGVLLQESRALGGYPAVAAHNSTLTFEQNQLGGGAADIRFQMVSAPAVELHQCDATFAMCQLSGGIGDPSLPPSPAMLLANSTVTMGSAGAFSSARAGPAGRGSGSASAVLGSNSTLVVDPLAVLDPTGSVPPTQGVTLVVDRFPSLGASMFQSHTLMLTFGGAPANANLFVLGLPSGPLTSPIFTGALWLDPSAFTVQVGVPANTTVIGLPPGATLMAQVVSLSPSGSVSLSNPAALIAR